ncbi:MAG: hypothetical protein U0271_08615 [Polyangiaceae bacterium]
MTRTLLITSAVLAGAGCSGCGDDEGPLGGGGSTNATTGGAGGVGGSGGAGGQGGSGGDGVGGALTCPPNVGVALGLTSLDFGVGNNGQWKTVGFNVDGLVSDGNSTDVCKPNSDASPDIVYPDGDNGIDNSFGKNLVPLILALKPGWPDTVNGYLTQGFFSTILKMYCLPPTGDAVVLSKVFAGTTLGTIPKFDGTDMWPVAPEVLSDLQDPESSTLIFPNSTVTGSTFDSGQQSTFVLLVPISFGDQIASIKLTVYNARIKMTLSDDRKSATGGVIGGVLKTEEVVDQLKAVAFLADYCSDALYPAMLKAVRQASDIMSDGTQDPNSTCDGISFGVKFEMKEVQIGDVGPASPQNMTCP